MKKVISGQRVPIKVWTDFVEPEAEQQLRDVASLPFVEKHVAVMPDVHAGRGSTIGTVIATRGAIIPATVGVDIGCGMCAVKLPFKVDVFGDSLKALRSSIERSIPVGMNSNKEVTNRVGEAMKQLGEPRNTNDLAASAKQIGTLGGGNHFIEICQDADNNAWVMLHSGSRNIGKRLADIHVAKARGLMKRYFIDTPNPDLSYLVQGTDEFDAYMHDLHWAQQYAKANRNEMMLRILKDISFHLYKEDRGADALTTLRIDCHHNYVAREDGHWITRKGAVSAKDGELGIIPGSMGAKSYIVKGKGNQESFCSCSHGAGRTMSRTKAKAVFTEADLVTQTAGVECRKDAGVLDEIPGAYKNIDEVMNNQADLVEPVFELKQILCIKG